MEQNPYDTPSAEPNVRAAKTNLAVIALTLSLTSVGGMFSFAGLSMIQETPPFALAIGLLLLMFSCAVGGLITGIIAAFTPSRRMAIWAAIIGFYVSMHIPTFYIGLTHLLRQ